MSYTRKIENIIRTQKEYKEFRQLVDQLDRASSDSLRQIVPFPVSVTPEDMQKLIRFIRQFDK